MESIYIFIWIIFGLLAMVIYNRKGRSALVGFLGGFLLGPIGLILALISGDNKTALARKAAEEEKRQIQSGVLKKCPHCAEVVKAEARVCKHCGRDL